MDGQNYLIKEEKKQYIKNIIGRKVKKKNVIYREDVTEDILLKGKKKVSKVTGGNAKQFRWFLSRNSYNHLMR